MSIYFDKVPKDNVRRREVAIFLREARTFKPHSGNRESCKTFCRGMAMAYWLEEHKYILATRSLNLISHDMKEIIGEEDDS